MNRRDLLQKLLLGLGALSLPPSLRQALAVETRRAGGGGNGTRDVCWVTPEETAGPFYFDPQLLREDIREDRDGITLDMQLTVVDENCIPRPGVLVDVWHCDVGGCYSGYNQVTCNAVGETFLRGTQVTDGEGRVHFLSIYPGWYPGRATHVHFKVRSESETFKTSQFAFPDGLNEEVYNEPPYDAHGQNPTGNAQDGIFGSDLPEHQVMFATGDPIGGYQGEFTIGLEANGTDVWPQQSEGELELQSWPAAFQRQTTLQASLPASGFVKLSIYDTGGRRVRRLSQGWQERGRMVTVWDGKDERGRSLPAGVYLAAVEQNGHQAAARLIRVK